MSGRRPVLWLALLLAAVVGGVGVWWLLWPPPEDRSGQAGFAPGIADHGGLPSDAVPGGADLHSPAGTAPGVRPASWAEPLTLPGCPNLHRVSPDLYRGAQPTVEGFRELEKLGVRTIVNLRSFHSDRDEMEAAGTSMRYEHITMKAWHAEDHEVVRFLKIMADRDNLPAFVHCQHGADRTGTMSAVYRIAVQGWTKPEALREMADGGYGFHGIWQNLLRYIDGLDVEEVKRRAREGSPSRQDAKPQS